MIKYIDYGVTSRTERHMVHYILYRRVKQYNGRQICIFRRKV